MTLTDWFIDIALLLIVFRQFKEERLTARTFILPAVLIGWVMSHYLHTVPTAGNDLELIVVFTAIGIVFGLAGGLVTRVRYVDNSVKVKATVTAAALWVISMGFRLGFAVWADHDSGAASLAHFSARHDITTSQAWVAALVLMACGEVIVRLGIIALRGRALSSRNDKGSTGRETIMLQMPHGKAS